MCRASRRPLSRPSLSLLRAPLVTLPASTPVWVMHAGSGGGGGNDISCGQYATEALLRAACEASASCKGYSIYNGRPWCMKNKIDTGHNFYSINR